MFSVPDFIQASVIILTPSEHDAMPSLVFQSFRLRKFLVATIRDRKKLANITAGEFLQRLSVSYDV